jgi:16S rRNA (cytosine1402-N4)-methyltransferase
VDAPGQGRPAHEPVLLRECLELLAVRPGGFYVDGTLGLGGHAQAILEASGPDGTLLGVDRDAETLELTRARLLRFGARARLEHRDWRELPARLAQERALPDGVLLDLGVSSVQLDTAERGFSFRADGPLDMRMDRSQGPTAADLVNELPEPELADLIFRHGEDHTSRRIAGAIVAARRKAPIRTTAQLAEAVRKAARGPRRGIDPATRTFQALRIAVNHELEGLPEALQGLAGSLAPRGRLAVISFHSLEDRPVKQAFRGLAAGDRFQLVTKKAVRPTPDEEQRNPRARSAKLRALARVAA